MDVTDTNTALTIVCAIAIVVGIFGTVLPFVPGLLLSWGGVLLWAIFADGGAGAYVSPHQILDVDAHVVHLSPPS